MNRVTITLTIDLPDGVIPDVEYGTPQSVPEELRTTMTDNSIPLEPAHIAETFAPFGGGQPPAAPLCSTHGSAMVRWPAGINKQGKKYNASWRCPVKDCPTKPIWDRDAA